MKQFILILSVLFLVSCASLKSNFVSQKKNHFLMQSAAIQLTKPAVPPREESKFLSDKKPWQWRSIYSIGAPMQSFVEPVSLGNGEWIVATLGGGLGRWNLLKGYKKWQIDVDPGVASIPLVKNGFVYFVGMDALMRKVDVINGKIVWQKKLSAESTGGVALANGFLYVNTADDTLWALDEKTGNLLWTYKRPSNKTNIYWSLRGAGVPALSDDGKTIYIGFSDGTFVALEAVSGQTIWERQFEQQVRVSDVDMGVQVLKDTLFMVHADGALYALNAKDGSVKWTMPEAASSAPFLGPKGDFLYHGSRGGDLRKINAKTGAILWSQLFKNPGHLSSVRLAKNNVLVVSGSHSGVYFVDEQNGALLHFERTGLGPIGPAAVEGNHVYVISPRNHLLRFYLNKPSS